MVVLTTLTVPALSLYSKASILVETPPSSGALTTIHANALCSKVDFLQGKFSVQVNNVICVNDASHFFFLMKLPSFYSRRKMSGLLVTF